MDGDVGELPVGVVRGNAHAEGAAAGIIGTDLSVVPGNTLDVTVVAIAVPGAADYTRQSADGW